MSSLPNPSHLALTPGRRHRHRRSAAISGDFDLVGLGLFSPTTYTNTHTLSTPNNTASDEKDYEYGKSGDDLDRHFNFNNEDDFCKKPTGDGFSFPNKTPDMSQNNQRSFTSFTSPPRRPNNYSLNSPIRLNHSRSASTSATPKTKFFLTEETNFNNENVPDAVIDLDEILKANTNMRDNNSPSIPIHKRTQLTPPELSGHDEFLASPFLKPASSPFISSPLSSINNPLFQQLIKEQTSDNEDINDIDEIDELEEMEVANDDNIDLMADHDEELFTNPQHTLEGLYSNSSANSSCSSLRSSKAIEKTLSNTSNNSGISSGRTDSLPQTKRSGAKANRYQSFYDQSFKVSNALKVSSSESINIVRSNSITIRIANTSANKEIRLLGHSSSLPSLKSNSLKRINPKPSRLGDTRVADRYGENRYNESRPIHFDNNNVPPPSSSPQVKNLAMAIAENKDETTKIPRTGENQLGLGKNNSTSPTSITSNYTSLSINGTTPSTEHSSLLSQQGVINKSDISPSKQTNQTNKTNLTTLDSVRSRTSTSNTSIVSDTNASNVSNKTTVTNDSNSTPPAIVVSSDQDSSPSTDATFEVNDEQIQSPPSSTTIPVSTISMSVNPYTPRLPSPKEEAFLRGIEIPSYKKSNDSSPKKSIHSRSKSSVVDEMVANIPNTHPSDNSSLKLKRRSSKIINWFKRR
jgi:hypothetical protein